MSDLLDRLRKVESSTQNMSNSVTTNWYRNPDGPEAANEIERLRATVSRCLLNDPSGDCYAAEVVELRARLAEALNLLENCRPALSEMRESAHTCEDKAAWATLEEDVWRFIDAADQENADG